jgi:poly(A) polymerase
MKKKQKEQTKVKLPPIQEIYNRIIWDKRLNKKAFIIGFTDRMSRTGVREKPLIEWNTGEIEIPWHRIQYIRCGDTKLWDRQQRIDRFASDQFPTEAWARDLDEDKKDDDSFFLPKQIYEFTANVWKPFGHEVGNNVTESLRIVTWNVLSDTHEKELIKTHLRIPAIIAQLKQTEADIIVVQEATVPLLHALMREHWVKQMYISESREGKNIEPQGIIILAKYPFTLSEYTYSPQKKFLVGHWIFHHQSFHVAALHLTSNRSDNAIRTREKQLQAIMDYLQNLPGDTLLAGDFNAREEDIFLYATEHGFEDIWPRLHPNDPGYTFDPVNNYIAKKMTVSGYPGRFDRIFVKSARKEWKSEKAELFARQPIPDTEGKCFPSDHFALLSVLTYRKPTSAPSSVPDTLLEKIQTVHPTYHSAIVVIPDGQVWPAIQHLRKRYDRNYRRWMPHITLIYGFVPEELLEAAAQLISDVVKDLEAFTITLTAPGTFIQRASTTGWIQPVAETEEALHTLQAAIQRLFPTCNEQSSKAAGFHPHLTIGQFASEEDANKVLAGWKPVAFNASSVALISRKGKQPFEVRYKVHLKTGIVETAGATSPPDISSELKQLLDKLHPALSTSEKKTRAMLIGLVREACSNVLGYDVTLDLFGSSRLDIATPQSDIDLICLIPHALPRLQFLEEVKGRLTPTYGQARLVTDVQVPALKLTIDSISIDLLAVSHPFFPAPFRTIKEEDQMYYDQGSWQTLVGCMEADYMLRMAGNILPEDTFRAYIRAVRAWANARKITGNGFGYVGNFSWAVLATWACCTYQPVSDTVSVDDLLVHFFHQVSKHSWPEPVGLNEEGEIFHAHEKRDWMPILTSIKPRSNSARNLTRSTFHVIREELTRAAEAGKSCLEKPAEFRGIYTPYQARPEAEGYICLTLETQNEPDLELCMGFLEGSLLSLLLNLEQKAELLLRPSSEFDRKGTSATLSIEIKGDPHQKKEEEIGKVMLEFEKAFYAWGEKPEKSELLLYLNKKKI